MTRHRAHTRGPIIKVQFDFRGSAQFEVDLSDPRYSAWDTTNGQGILELARALAFDGGLPLDAEYLPENIEVEYVE